MDISGSIDLYVQAGPDLLPRQCDDIALSELCRAPGIRAALHRSHFAITADRSALARNATHFALHGAVVLNDHVGGLDPAVTIVRMLRDNPARILSLDP